MSMTKAEMVELLHERGQGSKTTLRKKSVEELEYMINSLNTAGESEKIDNTVKENNQEDERSEDKGSLTVLYSYEAQLNIFTEFMYHVVHDGAVIKVENLGGGDVYVDSKPVNVGDFEKRLTFGETTVIKDANVVYLIAASQPNVRITELK